MNIKCFGGDFAPLRDSRLAHRKNKVSWGDFADLRDSRLAFLLLLPWPPLALAPLLTLVLWSSIDITSMITMVIIISSVLFAPWCPFFNFHSSHWVFHWAQHHKSSPNARSVGSTTHCNKYPHSWIFLFWYLPPTLFSLCFFFLGSIRRGSESVWVVGRREYRGDKTAPKRDRSTFKYHQF